MAVLCQGWGFAVHRHLHASAVEALEEPLRGWFEPHQAWLAEHAVDPDKRKRMVPKEAPKHYIDLDAPALGCLHDLSSRPKFSEAKQACSEDTLWAYGVLPWNLQWAYQNLVESMDALDRERILRAASDLGHYAGDAHVPLHTSVNYNGQLTGQDGIHGLWETRLPELYGSQYALAVPPPIRIGDVEAWAWQTVTSSHLAVDSVLSMERALVESWSGDLMTREERGRVMQQQRVKPWCDRYHMALDGMVERKWRASIHAVASLWTSAWYDAGQPDLSAALAEEPMCGWWQRLCGRCPLTRVNP